MSRKLTGPERAAVLLMNLGEDIAAKVLVNLDDREIQNIGNYISDLGDVDLEAMDSTNKDFYDMVQSGIGGLGKGGMDFLKSALTQALDPAKATEILNNITTPGEEMGGGLETVRLLDPKIISSFIVNEHPQTLSLIHISEPTRPY